jgi:predicted nucleic-acid-binding protein
LRAVDTNVLARWVLNDDPVQSPIASDVMKGSVWISWTVLLELGWVLEKPVGLPRQAVAAILLKVLDLDTAEVVRRPQLRWAIERYKSGADWADMMHLVTIGDDADSFATFERKLERRAGERSPVPIETLGKR